MTGYRLVKLFLVISFGVVACTALMFGGSKREDENSFRTNRVGYFPVNARGRLLTVEDLSDDEQMRLLNVITALSPENEAMKAIKSKDYRLMGIIRGDLVYYVEIKCISRPELNIRYALNPGKDERGAYWSRIERSWNNYSKRYNFQMFAHAPTEKYQTCLVGYK